MAAVDVAAGATVPAAGASAASGGWTPAQDGAGVVDGEYLLCQFAAAAPGARLRLVNISRRGYIWSGLFGAAPDPVP